MKKQKATDFGEHLVSDPDEYEGVCYAVIEEPYDEKGKLKTYDLLRGVFDDLQVAIYSEYISGSYNYL